MFIFLTDYQDHSAQFNLLVTATVLHYCAK